MKCAFCDSEAVKDGGEHLWDDWINKELPKKTRFNVKKRLSLGSKPIQYVSSGLNEQIPSVCEKCNSGWMSALTAKMKERFAGSLLKAKPFSLGPRDAAILAAFTFMKAAVKDYGYGGDPFFTRAARERLRNSLIVPGFVKIWFAAFQGSARYGFYSNITIVGANPPDPAAGMEFLSYTYVQGNLVLQLLAPRWKNVLDRGRPLISLIPNACWQPAVIQFWPCTGESLPWPPSQYFGDDAIEPFINRFDAPIRL
jgi:hypothetical protein